MKILITGAHFTPAQAVIEEFLENYPDVKVVYLGRKTTREGDPSPSAESQVLPKLGVKFYPIMVGRLMRIISIYTLTSLLKMPVGFLQSFYYLIKEKPDVVLSFGGYVGVPVVISGWLLNIPILVHEQTLVSGLANSISNFFADKIAVSFKKGYSFSKEKIILTGNPIRKSLLDEGGSSKTLESFLSGSKRPLIYVTGGNQGSHAINSIVKDIVPELTKSAKIIHQTGDSKFNDFEILEEVRNKLAYKDNYLIQKWFDVEDISFIFRNANLVISRAGANTLLELSYFGVPTIIIPLPFSNKDEQVINAKFFKEKGLGEFILEKNLTAPILLSLIEKMLSNKSFKEKAVKTKNLVIKDAAKRLAQETYLLGVNGV